MQALSLPFDPRSLPRPARAERAAIGLDRWRERAMQDPDAALAAFAASLAGEPPGRALLEAVFGNSPFLSQCLLAESAILEPFLAHGADAVFGDLLRRLGQRTAEERDTTRLMQALRVARRQAALTVALADITGAWPLERVTHALSAFADTTLGIATGHLLRRAAEAGEIALPYPEAPEHGSGLVVVGMGKLGAHELNYSSDIDLIILYETELVEYRGRRTVQDFFVRLARDLVRVMQDKTEEGYVFRTDLRLRPDPASTPLALSVLAAETYYEGMGQNWERAAMIKARVVAGDHEAGSRFLRRLTPFVWRKHLDFAAIQDIHSIKRQIHAVKGFRHIAVGGHNIKVGRGGIREIEFFAQTQQLIWGGRDASLRQAATCDAIRALVDAGRVRPDVAADLIAAYKHLRMVEHRLQMIDDQQTQTLPREGPELDHLACFCGFASTAEFTEAMLHHLGKVEDHYAELFEEAPTLSGPGSLVFTGTEDDPDTVRTLKALGFSDGASISNVVRGWHTGRYRAMRSARARELLTELMPTLLQALGKTAHPDIAFARFDAFLRALPSGVQLLSLLHANPGLLDLIAEIMGGAPRLAEHLSRNPALLEAVLTHRFFELLPPAETLRKDLRKLLGQATDFQDVLDLCRRWTKDHQFQVGVALLRGLSDGHAAGGPLTDVAETVLGCLLPHVEAEFANHHGRLPGDGIAVVGLGKLGSREMMIGSDIDLVFLYDSDAGEAELTAMQSDGPKPLAPIHYFARLSQRIINAITAPTGEGKLYEVDMRLRPSGNSGPIATPLPAFRRYQEQEAWSWEHMALTRARVIAAAPGFRARIDATLREILTMKRDGERLAAEVADMRARIAEQHGEKQPWDIKHRRGGLIDIEFVAQYLQLRHGAAHPDALHPNTIEALRRLARAGVLDPSVAEELEATLGLWHRVQGMQRLVVEHFFEEDNLPSGLRAALARGGGAIDFDTLKDLMAYSAERVRGHFEALIGPPRRLADQAAPPRAIDPEGRPS
jgi:glutamate-ammonia-ligase adenylyltransferase